MRICWGLFLLLFSGAVWAGTLEVEPSQLTPGKPVLVRWRDKGPVRAQVEFNGRSLPLVPTAWGGQLLLGTDLAAPVGEYPLRLRAENGSILAAQRLQIHQHSYPEERLRLPENMVSPQQPAVLQRIARERARLREIFSRSTPGTVPTAFQLPVNDAVGSGFGLRRILNGQPRSPHAGIDFRSPRGTPVHSSAAGLVVYVGELYYTGLTIIIDHGNGLFSLYCHLDSAQCAAGRWVSSGEPIGRVGSSGRSTGAHLHWGIKLRGERIDPLALTALLGGKKS